MTTVTPSDRAGATSAKRSASIPTQRSGQALRLLVLGTGEGAAAFRERAAEAGAELAQRFSVRVTHVVAEDGIGEEDARVVRARAAGLPVLGLGEGIRLFDGGMSDADADVDADADAGTSAAADDGETHAGASVGAEGADADESVAEAQAVTAAVVSVVADEASSHHVQLVRPRSEFVPEPAEVAPIEVGPADVFTGSALEAVLLFPPLPTDELVDDGAGAGPGAESEVESGFDSKFESGSGDSPSALMDVASTACGCGDGEAKADVGTGAGAQDVEGDVEVVEVAEVGVVAAEVASARPVGGTASSVAWALVPLVSLGLLTPVAMGYAAYRLRSRALWAVAAGYTALMAAAFVLSAAAPSRSGSHSLVGELLTVCLIAPWLGGTVHGFLIRRRVFG